MNKIKSCPFCGGDARLGENPEEGFRYIECTKCMASSRAMYPLKDAVDGLLIEHWNRREDKIECGLNFAEVCVVLDALDGVVSEEERGLLEEHNPDMLALLNKLEAFLD